MAFFEDTYQPAARLAAENPVLPLGDIWVEADTGKAKRGNGSQRWNDLPYWSTDDALATAESAASAAVALAGGVPIHISSGDDIAAAVAALVAGDELLVNAGTYAITAALEPPSNTTIEFRHGAVIQVPAGCTFHAINIVDASSVSVVNPVIVKASGAAAVGNVAGVRVAGASTDVLVSGADVSELGRGFDVDGAGDTVERVTFRDCTSSDAVQFGIGLAECDVVTIENFRSLGSGLDSIKPLKRADNVTIDGFYLTGALVGDGIDTYAGGGKWNIVNGISEGHSQNGIVVKSSTLNAVLAATITAADDLITATDHTHTNNTAIVFSGLAGAAPLVNGTTYYIRDVTANTFKVSATLGGTAIDITSDGSGTFAADGYGFVESIVIDNVQCRDNVGAGLTIHRDAGDSATDHTLQPLPCTILVGSVIAEGNGNFGLYVRANGVIVSQVIANGNGLHGIEIDGASIDVTIANWQANGNGTSLTNTYDGCHVEGGTRIRIGPGNARGAWVQGVRSDADIVAGTATQRYGLRVETAVTSFMAWAPFGANNATGLLSYPANKGWVFPSTDVSDMVLPNLGRIMIYDAGGTQRAAFAMASSILDIGSTGAVTRIRSSAQVSIPGPLGLSSYNDLSEMTAPAAPAANTARLYAVDNGAGKTQLVVRFPTGAVQVLATEP